MISVLVDHNIEGWADMLARSLQDEGWTELLDLSFVRFPEVGLSKASTDREVWRLAQQHQMILLTANRTMTGVDSLADDSRGKHRRIFAGSDHWQGRAAARPGIPYRMRRAFG